MLNLSITIYKKIKEMKQLQIHFHSWIRVWWEHMDLAFNWWYVILRCCNSLPCNLKKICHNLNLDELFWLSEVETKIDRYQALLDFHSCCCYTILTYFWFILQIGKAIYPSWEQEDMFRVVVLKVVCDSKYDAKLGKGVSD